MGDMQFDNDEWSTSAVEEITDILFDGDNTIWDWVTYAAHAYDAMLQCIVEETKKPENKVIAAMKAFYTEVGTLEHEGLIQGMEAQGFFKNVPQFDRDELIHKVQAVFSEMRRKHLRLYDGMQNVLETLAKQGKRVKIITDAPEFQAKMRVRHFKLDPFIKDVYAMAGNTVDLPKKFQKRRKDGHYKVDFPTFISELEKPYSDLESILKMMPEQISRRVLIVGDNTKKDIELAKRFGCRAIYSAYGIPPKEYLERLLRLAPEKVTRKNSSILEEKTEEVKQKSSAASSNSRVVTANEPSDILKYLKIKS